MHLRSYSSGGTTKIFNLNLNLNLTLRLLGLLGVYYYCRHNTVLRDQCFFRQLFEL